MDFFRHILPPSNRILLPKSLIWILEKELVWWGMVDKGYILFCHFLNTDWRLWMHTTAGPFNCRCCKITNCTAEKKRSEELAFIQAKISYCCLIVRSSTMYEKSKLTFFKMWIFESFFKRNANFIFKKSEFWIFQW